MENLNNNNEEKYIIAFIIKLIRQYKKMILILAGFFFVSALLFKLFLFDKEEYSYNYVIRINSITPDVSSRILDNSLTDLCISFYLSNIYMITPYQNHLYDGKDDDITKSLIKFVKSNKFIIKQSEYSPELNIEIRSNLPKDKIDSFVFDFTNIVDSLIGDYIQPKLVYLKTVTEKAIDNIQSDLSTKTDMNVYQSLKLLLIEIDEYVTEKDIVILKLQDKSFSYNLTMSFKKFVAIAFLVSVVLAVIIPVCIEIVRKEISNVSFRKQAGV